MRLKIEHERRRRVVENVQANLASARITLEYVFKKLEHTSCCEFLLADCVELFMRIDKCQDHLEDEWQRIYNAVYEGRR